MTTVEIKNFKGKNYLEDYLKKYSETFGSKILDSFKYDSDYDRENSIGLEFTKVDDLTHLKEFLKSQGFREYQKYDETTNGFYTSGNVFYIYLKPEKSTSNSNTQTAPKTDSLFSQVAKNTGFATAAAAAANMALGEEIQRIKKLLK